MLLFEVPNGSWVRILGDVKVPPGAPPLKVGDIIHFGHVDGMYSFCHNTDGLLVHLVAWAAVEVVSPKDVPRPKMAYTEVQEEGDLKGLRTHTVAACAGEACSVHNPSDHHMRTWPRNWRFDTGVMERICPHGVGHPDPDHLDFVRRTNPKAAEWQGIHGCDGCCNPKGQEGGA